MISNVNNIDENFIERNESGLVTQLLGLAAGSQKIYINIDNVPPKTFSTKYHSHSQQEEFFLILDGCGVLRFNNEEHFVQKGDFVAKLPAQNIAHTFYNSGNDILRILDVGTVEKEDTCYYPDEDIYQYKSNGERKVFKSQSVIKNWVSDPNIKTDTIE